MNTKAKIENTITVTNIDICYKIEDINLTSKYDITFVYNDDYTKIEKIYFSFKLSRGGSIQDIKIIELMNNKPTGSDGYYYLGLLEKYIKKPSSFPYLTDRFLKVKIHKYNDEYLIIEDKYTYLKVYSFINTNNNITAEYYYLYNIQNNKKTDDKTVYDIGNNSIRFEIDVEDNNL